MLALWVGLGQHGAHDCRRGPRITRLERPFERERRRVAGLRLHHAHDPLPLQLIDVWRLQAARVGIGGEAFEGGVRVHRPQAQQGERFGRAAQLRVPGRRGEVLERVAERPRDRDVLLRAGEVLAWQRVVQELLEVVARDAERRAVLVGPEPSERAAQIERGLAAQPGRVAVELGLVDRERHPRRIPPAPAHGDAEARTLRPTLQCGSQARSACVEQPSCST